MSETEVPAGRPRRRLAPYLVFSGALATGVAVTGLFLVFHLYNIPSGSEVPTMLVGDVVLASKWSYGFSRYSFPIDLGFKGRVFGAAPQRGDNVIFKLPRDGKTDYVKRVIGLPGDTIQMTEGRLVLNGTVVKREPIAEVTTTDFTGKPAKVPTYRETLPNGVSYDIVEIQGDTGFLDNTVAYKVPPDSYFMMGDNRDNSMDSRVPPDEGGVGPVPFDHIVAKVELVLYNVRQADRLLKPIH